MAFDGQRRLGADQETGEVDLLQNHGDLCSRSMVSPIPPCPSS